jgi:biotin carboxylase
MEALLAASRAGYEVCHIGRPLPPWARRLVHDVREVDTYEPAAVDEAARDLARRHDLRGVVNLTDVDVENVARVAHGLGLPGMPAAAARRSRNKWEAKSALSGLERYLPRFERVHDLGELRAAVRRIGFPAIVKPTGASGSKGIFDLHEDRDLAPAMDHLLRIARPDNDPVFRAFGAEFIVEQFATGPEVSAEGFVQDGRVVVVAVTDKITSEPFHLEVQHIVPTSLEPAALEFVTDAATRIVTALGFDHCGFHLEGKVVGDRFTFIESAARPAGDYIASHLIPLATGIDYFANLIRLAVGDPIDVRATRAEHAGLEFLLAPESGLFDGLEHADLVLERPGYEHLFVEVPVGSPVRLPPEHFTTQRVAAVIARHSIRDELDALLAEARKGVRVRIAPAP